MEDEKQKKGIAREMMKVVIADSKDVLNSAGSVALQGVAALGKGALYLACKASYPILGNLSQGVQERFEKLVGKDNYDSVTAMRITYATNFIPYTLGGGLLTGYLSDCNGKAIAASVIGSLALLVAEKYDREGHVPFDKPFNPNARAKASLVGKIASLPLDIGINVYNYITNLKGRAKAKLSWDKSRSGLEQKANEGGR